MKSSIIKQASFFKFIRTMLTESGRSVQISAARFGGDVTAETASQEEITQFRDKAHSGNYMAGASGMLNPGLFK